MLLFWSLWRYWKLALAVSIGLCDVTGPRPWKFCCSPGEDVKSRLNQNKSLKQNVNVNREKKIPNEKCIFIIGQNFLILNRHRYIWTKKWLKSERERDVIIHTAVVSTDRRTDFRSSLSSAPSRPPPVLSLSSVSAVLSELWLFHQDPTKKEYKCLTDEIKESHD